MGTYQISHIHVTSNSASSTEKITDVRLRGDYRDCTVAQIVKYLEEGNCFFYITTYQTDRSFVEGVYPINRKPYIRTKSSDTTIDALFCLPRF